MSAKVSVILPSLNVAAYIRECLDSVTNQSLHELEIICIDRKSTRLNSSHTLDPRRSRMPSSA